MNLIEFISFIASFALFIFLMARRAIVDMRRRQEYQEEEMQEEEEVVLSPPPVTKKKIPHPKPHVSLEPVRYEVHSTQETSRADTLLKELPALKNMLIYHEIFGPPKSLQ